nr:hypothetical protein [Tanacetum cinerariifolium]
MLTISLKLKMTQFYLQNQLALRNIDVIEEEVNTEVEEAFVVEIGKKLKGIATEDPTVQSLLDLRKGSKESKLEIMRQKMQACRGEGSNTDKDDAEIFDMSISDDDSTKGDDAAGFEKLEAVSTINVYEAIEESVQAKDPPNDHEGKKRSKRRKDARESSSKSSKKGKAPMDSSIDGIPTMVAKKLKGLIKKNNITIAHLESAGLQMLNRQNKNYAKLEYLVDQLKVAMLEEAQWNDDVHKFYDGTLLKVQDDLLKMLNEKKLGRGNVKLEGREQTKNDIKRFEVMLEKINKKLKHREQLRKLE